MSRNLWIGLVASVVVVAAAVALLAVVRSVGDEIDLPERVAGLGAEDSPAGYAAGEAPPSDLTDRLRRGWAYSAGKVSDAFDGAEAAVRSYRDPDDGSFDGRVLVTAVAADAGPLLPEGVFDDPALAGTAAPALDRVERGDVECLLRRLSPPLAAADGAEPEIDAITCQRTGGSLTVRVSTTSGDVDATADLVEELVEELGDAPG